MKEIILSNPLLLGTVVLIALIYFFVIFHYAGKSKKFVKNLEKIWYGILAITIVGYTGASIAPFDKLHPRVLSSLSTTPVTIIGQLGIYTAAIFLLLPRLRYTLKSFLGVIINLVTKSPFLCALIGIASLSFLWSNTPFLTFKLIITYLEVSLLAIYFGKQYSWTEIYIFLRWVNIIIVALSYYAVFFMSGDKANWSGIVGHKNHFSFFMAQTLILWLMHAVYSPKQRYLSLVCLILSWIAFINGNSGASKVLLVVLLGLWIYLGFAKKLKVQWAFVSVVLFFILSICLMIIVTENLEFIFVDTLNKDLTLTGRTEFWPILVNKINQHPILGYGLGGFWQPWQGEANPGGDVIVARTQFHPSHAHNGFLDLGLELGWLGLALFVMSFFNNVAKAVIYLGRNPMPVAGLPLLLLTYTLMPNITETGLFGASGFWFWYVVTTVRLNLETSESPKRKTHSSVPPAQVKPLS